MGIPRDAREKIGPARFSYDELLTALSEVEMVLNSRPRSYVSADDLKEPLTPSHSIVERRLMNTPDLSHLELDVFKLHQMTQPSELSTSTLPTINKFWERWQREYLVGLREVHSLRGKNFGAPRLSVGDVVIVHNDDNPKNM